MQLTASVTRKPESDSESAPDGPGTAGATADTTAATVTPTLPAARHYSSLWCLAARPSPAGPPQLECCGVQRLGRPGCLPGSEPLRATVLSCAPGHQVLVHKAVQSPHAL